MAYFSNSSDGDVLDGQCSKCKYGKEPCPVYFAQVNYNYDQNKDTSGTASEILNVIVDNKKGCAVFRMMKELEVNPNQTQIEF